ncbi:hypothetical protein N665_0725s0009 [Sinapis alba]|nr:hypothetical protein N665_0725s0009 [Sinapis alba]
MFQNNAQHEVSQPQFDWRTWSIICVGVAKCLAFLHEEVRLHIIHKDIKAGNILLDRDLSSKISDFGLARLMPPNLTHVSSRVAGTIYGVLLMETVSARSNINTRLPTGYQYLLEIITFSLDSTGLGSYERNKLVDLVDTGLNGVFDAEEACRGEVVNGEKDIENRNITRLGLISDFMDLKVKGHKPEEVNRHNNYTNLSSDNASSSTGTRDNSNAYSSGASSSTDVSSLSSTICKFSEIESLSCQALSLPMRCRLSLRSSLSMVISLFSLSPSLSSPSAFSLLAEQPRVGGGRRVVNRYCFPLVPLFQISRFRSRSKPKVR